MIEDAARMGKSAIAPEWGGGNAPESMKTQLADYYKRLGGTKMIDATIGHRVNWKFEHLNENHYGTIVAKLMKDPDKVLVSFDEQVAPMYEKPTKMMEVSLKELCEVEG